MDSNRTSPGSLFWKYFKLLFLAAALPLLIGGASEAWLGYRDRRVLLDGLLDAEARVAASKLQFFLDDVIQQLSWAAQLPWAEPPDEYRRTDFARLFRQTPAILSLSLMDGEGKERLFLSRLALNRRESRADRSAEMSVLGARRAGIWYGPVTLYRESEPRIMIAVSGGRTSGAIVVSEINLKLIWDVIATIQVGRSGQAFVLDQAGTLVAHPDFSLALRGAGDPSARTLGRLRAAIGTKGGPAMGEDSRGQRVLAALAPVPGPNWGVIVYQPLAEALGPIYAALWRAVGLIAVGTILAAALGFWAARRTVRPIQLLEDGAKLIGSGDFAHRIPVTSSDELGRLATQFNSMAGELAISLQRSERIDRLKRFLAPQVAELIEEAGDEAILESRRVEIVAVFCDLRGFTAFSAAVEPETVLDVLGSYYDAAEHIAVRFGATLTSRSGDGMMMIVNAPVASPDPALFAARMAIDLQITVQRLIGGWRDHGHALGFGIGLAMGPAAVGQIGSESRLDYTAIGSVVNLASRLCSSAKDRQILLDAAVAEAVGRSIETVSLGAMPLRGFPEPVEAYEIVLEQGPEISDGGA